MNTFNVREIVKEYLEKNGFDGLCGDECGCENANLLFACCGSADYCTPAYKHVPSKEDREKYGDDLDWIMKEDPYE